MSGQQEAGDLKAEWPTEGTLRRTAQAAQGKKELSGQSGFKPEMVARSQLPIDADRRVGPKQ